MTGRPSAVLQLLELGLRRVRRGSTQFAPARLTREFAMTTRRKPVDETFRLLVELPERWQTYITYDDATCFEGDDADDPWGQAAADQEIAGIEARGYRLVGPADDLHRDELGRFRETRGPLITYVAHRDGILDADTDARVWRFLAPGGDEYLLLCGREGIVWLPAHWADRVRDPDHEIDENDLRWPDDRGDPQHPPHVDDNQTPPGWQRGYPADPPPEDIEHWDEAAYLETVASLREAGWTIEQSLDHIDRMGWFRQAWGPVTPYIVTRIPAAEPRRYRPNPCCPSVETR
ncbi:MAG: hypothetical protein OXI15_02125 [Chromatiales bacterium]|nr:hypothetical protein [Chromatiales bacterium]